MSISTSHNQVQTNNMKPYRRPRQYVYHLCQPGRVAPGLGLLVSVCILVLPMLVLVDEHMQLTTMYHMNPINQWSVHPHHMTFNHTPLLLPSLSNVLPAMALQSRVARSNIGCASYSSSHSGVRHVPPILHLNLPSGLVRRVVSVVLVLLLLMSGDIETNPGPVGQQLSEKDLLNIMEELADVRAKWYNIGLGLGLGVGTLNSIKIEHSDTSDCLRETLMIWMKSYSPTWSKVVDALRTKTVGEVRLAADLEHKYCLMQNTSTASTTQFTVPTIPSHYPTQDTSTGGATLSPQFTVPTIPSHYPTQEHMVLLDKELVRQHVRQLQTRFRDLVINTYRILIHKCVHVDLGGFRSSLLALDVFQKHEHQQFINDHLMKIDPAMTFDDLWAKLNNYWNFLNFDLLEHIVSIFGSEELKKEMESYEHDLQSFRKTTRVCDFISCWPVKGETPPKEELKEFVVKMKHDWDNCTLEDLETLRGVVTRKFFFPSFAFQLQEIKKGCIAITWLVPAPLLKTLQETIKTTSSDFFLEHKIETVTIDKNPCYPSSSGKHVEYPEEQFTSQSTGEAQRDKFPLGKLHSIKSVTSEKQLFPKETHRMKLAEEILSGESTSMVPFEDIQLSGDIQSTPNFPSKLRQKFSIRPQMPSKHLSKHQKRQYTSETSQVTFDTPILEEMEALSGGTIPRSSYPSSYTTRVASSVGIPTLEELSLIPYTHLGGTKPRTGYSSSSSEDWFEAPTPPEKDVRKGDWVNPPTPTEKYVREKCVDEISRHVKLLPSVEQYLSKSELEADPSLPTKYKDYLSSTPAIRAALCTTFNAKMAAEVFTWSQHTESPPPTTMTELFTAFTLKTLVDHLSTHRVYHKQQLKVTTFSDLPTDVYKQFQDLCRMAYEGTLNRQQLVFSAAHFPTGFAPLGLMQEVPQLYTEGRASSYHFIHLTLQEYLAAIHISQLPSPDQTRLVREHLDSGHFKMTIRFMAGLTKLANIPPDITKKLMESDDTKLICFHLLFEAKDISMTTRPIGSHQVYVKSFHNWTPLDYCVTGHAISHSNCPWRLNFNNSFIDDEKLQLFCQGCATPGETGCRGHISYAHFSFNNITSKSIQSFVHIPPHILQYMGVLDLSHNELDKSACDLLAKAVLSMTSLEYLLLENNPIGSGGTVEVIKALCGSGVKKLRLDNTGIGNPDCEALSELLISSHSLNALYLASNPIEEEGVTAVARILAENKSLTNLWLFACQISGQGASELAAALCKNSTLKYLYMHRNPIGMEGASSMSDMLQHNTSLEELHLEDDSVREEGVHQLTNSLKHNQTLRELSLPKKYEIETDDDRIWWR